MPRLNSSPRDQLSLTSSSRAQIDVGYNDFDQASSLELIAVMKGKSMVNIGMENCKLGVEGAKAMAEMTSVMASLTSVRASPELQQGEVPRPNPQPMSATALRSLNLSINKLDVEAGKALASMLQGNTALKSLSVAHNGISGEAAQQLAAAVLGSKSLEVLSQVPIKELREDKLTELNLWDKGLGPTEAIVLAELLKVNTALRSLNLAANGLGAEGAKALAEMLKFNAAMASINLDGFALPVKQLKGVDRAGGGAQLHWQGPGRRLWHRHREAHRVQRGTALARRRLQRAR